MSPKVCKIAGYVVTGLLSAMIAFGGFMQITLNEQAVMTFNRLQMGNLVVIRFLGLMKILGAIGLWVPRGRSWAVHGLTFLFLGALASHLGAGDPAQEYIGGCMGLALLGVSEWLACQKGCSTGSEMGGNRHAA